VNGPSSSARTRRSPGRHGAVPLTWTTTSRQQAQGLRTAAFITGRRGSRQHLHPLDRDWWSEFTAVPDEFLDAGDEVVVLGRYRGTAKQTGKRLDVPFVHVWSLRDRKAWRFRQFLDTAGWVEALSDDS
jgi:ketosteroid isomerase-like protein